MGVYRYWCKHLHEMTWLVEELSDQIKEPGCDTTLSWDQEKDMWCCTLRECHLDREDLPF